MDMLEWTYLTFLHKVEKLISPLVKFSASLSSPFSTSDTLIILMIFFGVAVGVSTVFLLLCVWNSMDSGSRRVCIVVMGDLGRSPRMQYHALSFAREKYHVDFVGFGGSVPHQDLISNPYIKLWKMWESPKFLKYFPRLVNYVFKVLWQSLVLFLTVMMTKKSAHILLQNPPAIPTLAVLWLISLYRDSRLIVDWHNYGYTILGMALGNRHPLVRFSKWYEGVFGRLADGNICVTQAMREDLDQKWNIRAITMYDRPPLIFQECDLLKKYDLFTKLMNEYDVFKDRNRQSVLVQKMETGEIVERDDRPALLVSSTSWTEDEDFSLLLSALEKYDKAVQNNVNQKLPRVICAITGKGPLKEYYQGKIQEKNLKNVKICTPWLSAEDYPKLLGSADLGVCLHTSSSGLDLPMKVVDMFGCCLPVCAIHFKCLHELVKHGENGLIFHSETELASQLQELLSDYPKSTKLKTFHKHLRDFQKVRWNDSWKEQVWPLFR